MLGSILSNLLLVLGCSFFAAGFKFSETQFQVTAAQASASTLTLAVATLIIPAAYHANQKAVAAGGFFKYLAMGEDVSTEVAKKSGLEGLLFISRGTAIVSKLSTVRPRFSCRSTDAAFDLWYGLSIIIEHQFNIRS